ncbi:HNH endonuclease [Leptolyngbya cf. ectocarpi LEGE 11479]|uniref:HNH endonuclease n=1 Tax=Leptolyngbya cf. ectocarpi LEGE 11479 TaxID=1828722 RepID=A0A928ZWS5_LEPEC|nr:HNH endonuclease [Leptolyngbya ectocarpi]MBE9068892.1 HNH endonuclease [Leptolyngbya cf. ectocarpi LEGE 11479]
MNKHKKTLEELFRFADYIGSRRYHKMTQRDRDDYQKYDDWRYINGNGDLGTTSRSKQWVRQNSDEHCPVCRQEFSDREGRTIDHKLPRAHYPWLSLDFENLWVICHLCNEEKGERDWYEYERYILANYPKRHQYLTRFCPLKLLKNL